MAGLFFCLASAEGAGLLFCQATIQPNANVHIVFYTIHASYTAHAAKQHTGLCRRFSSYLPCFAAAVWRVHPAIPRRLHHAGTYHSTRAPYSLYQIPPPHMDAVQVSTAAYYNKVYKGAPPVMDPCQTAQHTADHASPAGSSRRLAIWHPSPGGAVQQQERGGRRGTIDGYRRSSFRAFAR